MTSAASVPVTASKVNNDKVDQLVLVSLSLESCTEWLNAVRQAGQPWHEDLVDDIAIAKALLQAKPKAHALICYDTPERQIANFIGNDCAPSEALARWMNQAQVLLDLYREHFHRITLVDEEALLQNSKVVFEHLAARSGIAVGPVTPEQPEAAADAEPLNKQLALYRLLAQQALQYPPAQRLSQEMEASSLPWDKSAELLDSLDSTYNILKQMAEDEAVAEEYQELKAKLDDVQQENDLVIKQLHKTQEELEQYLLGNRGGMQWRSTTGGAERELKKLKNSRSWRMTAPLRNSLQWLRGKKAWKKLAPLRKSIKSLLGRKKRGA